MRRHILLEKIFVYPVPKQETEMNGCSFNYQAGYWIINETQSPYILDTGRPKPQSKKSDVETGEDQKGE